MVKVTKIGSGHKDIIPKDNIWKLAEVAVKGIWKGAQTVDDARYAYDMYKNAPYGVRYPTRLLDKPINDFDNLAQYMQGVGSHLYNTGRTYRRY